MSNKEKMLTAIASVYIFALLIISGLYSRTDLTPEFRESLKVVLLIAYSIVLIPGFIKAIKDFK